MIKTIIPLRLKTIGEVTNALKKIDNRIDVVEIWLDHLLDDLLQNKAKLVDIRLLLSEVKQKHDVQILAVCKGPSEQGCYHGTPMQKWQLLQYFLEFGGDFIDLDVTRNPHSLIETLPKDKLWLSFHDFSELPTNLDETFSTMLQLDPYLYKFAVTVESKNDLNKFMQWCSDKKKSYPDKRFIFTTMGKFGVEGRKGLESKNLTWGGFWALSEELKTANGQRVL